MAITGHPRSSRILSLLQLGWYVGLATAAFTMLLVHGDPSAALILAIVLPVAMLRSPRRGTLASLAMAAGLGVIGFVLSARPELDPTLRSTLLSMGLLAPALGIAVAFPMAIRWAQERSRSLHEALAIFDEQADQSSTRLMSDSTCCGTLGKLTSETNRSKAA
ncbi:MAG: hypothetical protein VX527_02020 [Planctomycetota bacterium]|nr:hypothetical protein [Planctomycetota bacterium]